MKSILKNRVVISLATAILLVLLYAITRSYVLPRPILIGNFSMPTLSGWEQKVTRTSRIHKITYRKREAGNRLYIGLTWRLDRAANIPKNVQDLQTEIIQAKSKSTSILKNLGTQLQSGIPQSTSINGMTAVEIQDIMTSSTGVTYSKSFNFINEGRYYILTSNVTVPAPSKSPPPELQAEMDQALEKITTSLSS